MSGSAASGRRSWLHAFLPLFVLLVLCATGCYRAARQDGAESTPPLVAESAPEKMPAPAEETETSEAAGGRDSTAEGSPSPAPPDTASAPAPESASGELPAEPPPFVAEGTAGANGGAGEEVPAGEGAGTGEHEADGGSVAVARIPPPEGKGTKPPAKKESPPQPGAPPDAEPAGPPPSADAPGKTIVVARLSGERAFPQDGPPWSRNREELVYRVEFLGITMGYARFTYRGRVLLGGREAHHLHVRAWTSDLLSVIYPIDDAIDYYLDVRTLAPLRLEFTKSRKEDDVAIYDQEKGTIVYRYKKTGKIRKKIEAVPNVYDPVSVAYFFRSRDLRGEGRTQTMYAGRKLWEISAEPVGFERIRTDRGEFDTIIVRPVLRRDGKEESKGDLKMWMTRDERRVPVRVYGKFKKIRTWTLVGELLPEPEGG